MFFKSWLIAVDFLIGTYVSSLIINNLLFRLKSKLKHTNNCMHFIVIIMYIGLKTCDSIIIMFVIGQYYLNIIVPSHPLSAMTVRQRSRSRCASESDGRQCANSKDNNDKINQLFDQWSAATDLSSPEICAWDKFPTAHESKRICAKHLAWLNNQIRKFLLYDALYFDSQCAKSWKPMLQLTFPGMAAMQIHDILLALVVRTLHNRHMGTCSLDYIEYFSGQAELSKSGIRFGLEGRSFDIIYTSEHDALSKRGLRLFLAALAGTKPSSLTWFGTVCSSFTVLCRAQSLRQESNGYEGDTNRAFVQIGNGLATVSALLFLLTALMSNIPALEQPLNSCMPQYSVVNAVLTFCETFRITTYHGSFGAETVKPLQLLSPSVRIQSLIRSKPTLTPSNDSSLVTRDDSGAFTGQKEQLTQSQAYTREFGEALISAFFG